MFNWGPKPEPVVIEKADVMQINKYLEANNKNAFVAPIVKSASQPTYKMTNTTTQDWIVLTEAEFEKLSTKATEWVNSLRAAFISSVLD